MMPYLRLYPRLLEIKEVRYDCRLGVPVPTLCISWVRSLFTTSVFVDASAPRQRNCAGLFTFLTRHIPTGAVAYNVAFACGRTPSLICIGDFTRQIWSLWRRSKH